MQCVDLVYRRSLLLLKVALDDICEQGDFDRWQFRYDNALVEGSMTATGQILEKGVGIRTTLEAVKEEFTILNSQVWPAE